jgi:hypothetical protein
MVSAKLFAKIVSRAKLKVRLINMKTKLKNLLRGFIYDIADSIIDAAEAIADWAANQDPKVTTCSTCLQEIQK